MACARAFTSAMAALDLSPEEVRQAVGCIAYASTLGLADEDELRAVEMLRQITEEVAADILTKKMLREAQA